MGRLLNGDPPDAPEVKRSLDRMTEIVSKLAVLRSRSCPWQWSG